MNLPRKIISLLLALSILTAAGVFSCAFAAENSNSNQQKITVTAEKIKKDGTYIAIQNALEIARKTRPTQNAMLLRSSRASTASPKP